MLYLPYLTHNIIIENNIQVGTTTQNIFIDVDIAFLRDFTHFPLLSP